MIRGSALLSIFLHLAVLQAGEGASREKTWLVGPPAGERSEYEVQIVDSLFQQPDEERLLLAVTVLRPAPPADREAVLLIHRRLPDGKEDPELSFDLLSLEEGVWTSLGRQAGKSFRHELPLADALFNFVSGPAPGTRAAWKSAEKEPLGGTREKGQGFCNHVMEDQGPEGRFLLRSRLVKESEKGAAQGSSVPFLRADLGLNRWERELLVEKASLAPLSFSIQAEAVFRYNIVTTQNIPGKADTKGSQLSRRRLEAAELKQLAEELPDLKKALLAVDQSKLRRAGSGGLLAGLLGGAKKPDPLPDPRALIDAFEKAHPEGLLLAAARSLRKRLQEWDDLLKRVHEREEMDRRSAGLVGGPAPGFALKGLDGIERSLERLRGKVVLLVFIEPEDDDCGLELQSLRRWKLRFSKAGFEPLVVVAAGEGGAVKELEKETTLRGSILLKGDDIANRTYAVTRFPTSFLIDREGKVQRRTVGFAAIDRLNLEKSIEKAVGAAPDRP